MPIKAILFDHDGTLVNSERIHFELWDEVLARYGADLSEVQYRDYYAGVPTAANAVDMVSRFAINVDPAVLAEAKNLATRDFLLKNAFPLMPGVRQALSHFHNSGWRLAVVTGAGGDEVQATLRQHSLRAFFETVVAGDDVKNNKPAPDCYFLAVKRLALLPSECIAIEDTEHGVNAAIAAGVACLAVPTDMSKHHNFSKATAVFKELAETLSWVQNCVASRQ